MEFELNHSISQISVPPRGQMDERWGKQHVLLFLAPFHSAEVRSGNGGFTD
uniref:Uncharacterized protein n=1 Tax=Anguilla anguilla TaxID=7936 RepID=A0A0E9TL73_ANGAN